jgi:hypothetical protein
MDQARFEELKKKRFEDGLTDDEAAELGRMFAEEEGEHYSTALDRSETEDTPEAWKAEAEEGEGEGETVKEKEEAGEAAAVDTTEGAEGDHKPEEERAVGTERQPMSPTGAGYNPPKGSGEPVP